MSAKARGAILGEPSGGATLLAATVLTTVAVLIVRGR
jgi:hypothetical protein